MVVVLEWYSARLYLGENYSLKLSAGGTAGSSCDAWRVDRCCMCCILCTSFSGLCPACSNICSSAPGLCTPQDVGLEEGQQQVLGQVGTQGSEHRQ